MMTRHYPDLGRVSDWLKQICHAAGPISSPKQIWVVTRHQYGNFCARFSDVILGGNQWWRWRRKISTVLFSQANKKFI